MKTLPKSVEAYHRTAVFTEDTVPASLLNEHRTKQGVWAVIHVLSGQLQYIVAESQEETLLEPGKDGIVEPTASHRVTPLGPVSFYVEFWR